MVSNELIKSIIIENENFIIGQIKGVVPREGIALPSENLKKVVVFHGVRRSGKSFILYDLFRRNRGRSLYIDFEDERLSNIKIEEIDRIREAFFELKPHLLSQNNVVFLFDEIQNIGLWERFVRRLVEKEGISVYCAGSSSEITPRRIHSSLRGRVWSLEVFPFSFREFLVSKGYELSREKLFYGSGKVYTKNCFGEYLKFGGFPEVTFSPTEFDKRKVLKEYLNAMFFRDIVERFKVRNIVLLDALWDKLFSSFSTRFSLTAFYKQYKGRFSFSKDSLYAYYKYFLESMLIFEVKKFAESTYKRMRNPVKVYLIDVGLSRRVSSMDYGRLLENAVFIELRRKGYEVFYFQERYECDFIVKSDDRFMVFQVTWKLDEDNKERELGGVIEAAKRFNLKEAVVVTFDNEEIKEIDGITVIIKPFWKWSVE